VNRTPAATAACAYPREGSDGCTVSAAEPRLRPWVPDEPEPPGGWPAAPDAVPCVVSEWVLGAVRGGLVETRPVHSWLPHPAAAVNDDGGGLSRVRRFAAAWAALSARRSAAAAAPPALCQGCVRRLLRAGVLLELPTRRGGGTRMSTRRLGPKAD
jgi:hypothetical protein